MKNAKLYIALILGFCFSNIKAQEILTLEEAVRIALENNYDIKLSRNLSEINKNDVTLGNAGFLPALTGNLADVNRVETTEADRLSRDGLQTPETIRVVNAQTTNINYGVSISWMVFDGFRMFANYDRLKELEKLGQLNAKITVQNTIADVITAYFDLVSQEQQIEALKSALDISKLRYTYSNSRFTIGKSSKLEVLAAQVDLNADTALLLRQQDVFKASKIRLNEIMARDLSTDFTLVDTIIFDKNLVYEDLKSKADGQNPTLQTAVINQKVSEINLRQIKAGRYPFITLTSGYNFANSTAPPTSFAIRSNSRGLNYGFTASVNLFNGFQQNRLEKNARLEIENATIDLQKATQNINAQLLTAYQNYQTNLQLVNLEEKNIQVARQNLDITLEKYKLGSIVPLELREAQRNFVDATARYANSQFETKIAEVALKEITGNVSL